MTESLTRSRRTLLLLVALFFLPLGVAFLAYYSGWRPTGSTNHGELLQPIRQLPAAVAQPLAGKWSLAWVGDGACNADCQTALVFARQTRLSLAADTTRVNWVLLATDGCCNREYLDTAHKGIIQIDAAADRVAVLGVLPSQDMAQSLFVIDPLGNVVLRYDVRNNPRGLLEDMKKLLKLSHIG